MSTIADAGVAAADLAARHGHPLSFCLRYAAPWQYVVAERPAGAVAFLERNRVAVVWGDPLAAPEASAAVLEEATATLRGRRRRICLVLAGPATARHALAAGYGVLKIGEQPYFDLRTWHTPRGNPGKRLRWVLNKAARAGVAVRAYEPGDEQAVRDTLAAWETGLGRPPARSFLRALPLTLVEEKRLFVGRRNGRIEALVACTPVSGRNGWFLEDVIRRPDAPMGATEAVAVHALGALAAEGAELAWMDVAPLRGVHDQLDRRARVLFRMARPALAFFDTRYRFRALTTYLDKFQPTGWEARYVALNPVLPTPGLIRAVSALL